MFLGCSSSWVRTPTQHSCNALRDARCCEAMGGHDSGPEEGVHEAGKSPGFWPSFLGLYFNPWLLNVKSRREEQRPVAWKPCCWGTSQQVHLGEWWHYRDGFTRHGDWSSTLHYHQKGLPRMAEGWKESWSCWAHNSRWQTACIPRPERQLAPFGAHIFLFVALSISVQVLELRFNFTGALVPTLWWE